MVEKVNVNGEKWLRHHRAGNTPEQGDPDGATRTVQFDAEDDGEAIRNVLVLMHLHRQAEDRAQEKN